MVDTVTVAANDNISKLVKQNRGVAPVEVHQWVNRVLALNPHIGDPDRIYPNEKLLIPDSLNEPVSDLQVWRNALRRVPPQLGFHPPMHYEIPVAVIKPGDTIDRLAAEAFGGSRYAHVPGSVKRAVFLHNNPRLQRCAGGIPLPGGTLANMTPFMLPKHEVQQWEVQHPIFKVEFDRLQPEVQSIYTTIGPTSTYLLSRTVLKARSEGAAVGLNDLVSGAATGYVGANAMALGQTTSLMQDLTNDAVKKFGRGVALSNKAENLRKMERFLRNHPKYTLLMRHLKDAPKHLFSGTDVGHVIATTKSPYANARLMRGQVFMPTLKPNGTKYMGTIKAALNSSGRVVRVASKGMVVVPIVMGVCDVVNAPPQRRVRTLFEEGFGVVGGYLGSKVGLAAGSLIAISVLGLGPFGIFITVFLCTSIGSIAGYGGSKLTGNKLNDALNSSNSRIYYSIDELLNVE